MQEPDGDIIPEHIAQRRGLSYRLNANRNPERGTTQESGMLSPEPDARIRYGVLAPRSSGKENQSNVKPFIGTLRVTNPARQSWTSSRKRVLRGGG